MHTECELPDLKAAEINALVSEALRSQSEVPFNRDKPPTHINPFVVIRYDATDIGLRPALSGEITYLSPDILVTNLSGAAGVVANQPHLLQARLTNYGLFPANQVRVDFYWANPSMAITEASVNFIGSGMLPYLPAGSPSGPSSLVVDCESDWVPRFENGGHECLLARATIPTFDDAAVPLDPGLSYRVGQRNLTVQQVSPGQPFKITIRVANTARFTLPLQVVGGRLSEPLVKAFTQEVVRRKGRAVQSVQEGSLSWKISAEEPPERLPAATKLFAEQLVAQHNARQTSDKLVMLWEQSLPSLSEQKLLVQAVIPQSARPGTVYSLALQESLGPVRTGGYGLVLVVGER